MPTDTTLYHTWSAHDTSIELAKVLFYNLYACEPAQVFRTRNGLHIKAGPVPVEQEFQPEPEAEPVLENCIRCDGSGKIMNDGFVLVKCPDCHGSGFAEEFQLALSL